MDGRMDQWKGKTKKNEMIKAEGEGWKDRRTKR